MDTTDAVQLKDIVFGYDRNKPLMQVAQVGFEGTVSQVELVVGC